MRSARRSPSAHVCAALGEKRAQHRAMAARLVLAVAADREVRVARECREYVEGARAIRLRHLRAVLPEERPLLLVGAGYEAHLHRLDARREIGKPDVVPIVR